MGIVSSRAGLILALFGVSVPACRAQVPQAQINPVPLKLPIEHTSDIRFAHISTTQGLSQIRVASIVQDDQGFMWFGTIYGLNRFDGYTFKVYIHERGERDSLSGVDVKSLFKDRDGALWIGCDQAVDRFDPRTDSFTHFAVEKVKQTSQDRSGLLWFSTDRGLFRLDPKSGAIRAYTHNPSDPLSLPDNHVVATMEDKSGRFWVAEPYGIYQFDRTTGHVLLSVPLYTASRDISFHEDKEGGFWIIYGTGNGLAKFDRERKILTYYSFRAGDLSSTAYTGVDAMLEDRHGNLWLAKQGFGLLKFDREHNGFMSYTHMPGDATSLAENNVIGLFEDRDGSIWVGLPQSGLQRFSPVPTAFQLLSPKMKQVGCFYEDSHRNLWIGTVSALYRVDPSGKTTAFAGVKAGVPFDVLSVVEDRDGWIWVGTSSNGLFRLDPNSGHWKIYRHNENDPSSLSNDVVERLLVDHDGTLWAATWDGLDRFDARTESFTTFKANPYAREQIYLSLAEDRQHDLWLGTFGFGLQHLDPKTGHFTIYRSGDTPGSLSDSEVNWVHIASTGKLWLGTSNGLNEFDPATKHFTTYDAHDGMASPFIDCVLEDSRGKLWVSTTKGISSFNPATRMFRNFSTAEGLPGPEMVQTGGCLRTASGRMFFAGLSGATTFVPEAIPENNYPPPTVITDFRLLGNSDSAGVKITPRGISYASAITLSHKQTSFSLTFAALSYSDSPANRYRYKLDNLDSSWTEVGSDGRTVNYSALPAGKYRFRVQGATNSSQWSEPGATLEIVVLPPWWSTWWFRTTYVLAALLAIWCTYRYRMLQFAEQSKIRILAQVNERMRIARELHDTLLQDFQAVILRFQLAAKRVAVEDPNRAVLEEGLAYADKALTEGRNYIRDIRADTKAFDELSNSLTEYGNELSKMQPLTFSMKVTGLEPELDPVIRNEIHRIGREAIANAFKHSNGTKVDVEIAYQQKDLQLKVRDDGDGMNLDLLNRGRPGHWGIQNMKDRAQKIGATLSITSLPGQGTSLDLRLPLRSTHRFRDSSLSP